MAKKQTVEKAKETENEKLLDARVSDALKMLVPNVNELKRRVDQFHEFSKILKEKLGDFTLDQHGIVKEQILLWFSLWIAVKNDFVFLKYGRILPSKCYQVDVKKFKKFLVTDRFYKKGAVDPFTLLNQNEKLSDASEMGLTSLLQKYKSVTKNGWFEMTSFPDAAATYDSCEDTLGRLETLFYDTTFLIDGGTYGLLKISGPLKRDTNVITHHDTNHSFTCTMVGTTVNHSFSYSESELIKFTRRNFFSFCDANGTLHHFETDSASHIEIPPASHIEIKPSSSSFKTPLANSSETCTRRKGNISVSDEESDSPHKVTEVDGLCTRMANITGIDRHVSNVISPPITQQVNPNGHVCQI